MGSSKYWLRILIHLKNIATIDNLHGEFIYQSLLSHISYYYYYSNYCYSNYYCNSSFHLSILLYSILFYRIIRQMRVSTSHYFHKERDVYKQNRRRARRLGQRPQQMRGSSKNQNRYYQETPRKQTHPIVRRRRITRERRGRG